MEAQMTKLIDDGTDLPSADHERDTRTFGAMIKNIEQVKEMQADLDRVAGGQPATAADAELIAEADRFRREIAERLACLSRLPADARLAALRTLEDHEVARLACTWEGWARDDQLPPAAVADGVPWRMWVMLGGRGAGKTRAGGRVGACAWHWAPRYSLHARASHRARRRDAGPGPQRNDRRPVRPAFDPSTARAPEARDFAGASSSGPTAPWRRCSLPTIPTACAAPSSTPPGATSCASGACRKGPGTCCSSALRLGALPQCGHHHAAANRVADDHQGRSGHRHEPLAHRRQRRQPGAHVPGRDAAPLRRHAARPEGARRRDGRGPHDRRYGSGRG